MSLTDEGVWTALAATPRGAAWQILTLLENPPKKRIKVDERLDKALSHPLAAEWPATDKALCTALTYGVLRRWSMLGYWLEGLSDYPPEKMDPAIRSLIKLGLFQLRWMDQIPDYAAIDSTVALAKAAGASPKTVALVNGILRGFQRSASSIASLPPISDDPTGHFCLVANFPEWWTARLSAQYASSDLLAMAHCLDSPAPLSVRINTLKTTVEAYRQTLTEAAIGFVQVDPALPECLQLVGWKGSPQALPGYVEGLFLVQDLSACAVARWLSPKSNSVIVDLCAAPGGKTSHAAALMKNTGRIIAVEPSPKRAERLRENLARLGVTNTEVVVAEGEAFTLPNQTLADGVLVDVPCSGTGTVRKHPEILIQMREKDAQRYVAQQQALLAKGLSLLKPGGVLLYSTCSIDATENRAVVDAVLSKLPDYTMEEDEQRLITETHDGFYLARMVRAIS